MRHRGQFSRSERVARSRLAKVVHEEPFLCGSLVTLPPSLWEGGM